MAAIFLSLLGVLRSTFRRRSDLVLENLALRQQLAAFKHQHPRPRLSHPCRLFWVALSRLWPRWRNVLVVVKPETVVGWHRWAFRRFWTWRSRHRQTDRPPISRDARDLVKRMATANQGWGAPRIHGELLKLGIVTSEREVSRLPPPRPPRPPSRSWRTFPEDTAPKYMVRDRDGIYGDQFRRRLSVIGINEVLTAPRSPWQNPYAERLVGSVRRDCLDHMVVLGEQHLRRILTAYFSYYHKSRTYFSLHTEAPETRAVHAPSMGPIVEIPDVGGLHHHYERRAA